MTFWEKQENNHPALQPQPQQEIVLDEEVVAVIQGNVDLDIFENEEEDTAEIMTDVNLRLEQGRLYQMIMKHDLFGDTDADPKAIRNVQREIRRFVRERMETMVGIRQELPAQETIVSSPFNDLEVNVLKMLASKMSKGETERANVANQGPSLPLSAPKKDGITAINGNLRPQTVPAPIGKPLKKETKPAQKLSNGKAGPAKSAINSADGSALQKPIDQMTQEELAAHDAAAAERRKRNYAAMPVNLVPHPTPQQLEAMYTMAANQKTISNPWRINK